MLPIFKFFLEIQYMVCNCKSTYTATASGALPPPPVIVDEVSPKPVKCFQCNLLFALKAGALFYIIAHPEVYKLTGGDVLLHALVFALIVFAGKMLM